jgi:hypothetical protein
MTIHSGINDDTHSLTPPSGGEGVKSPSGDLGVELRSEEFQEVLGSVPHLILRWGSRIQASVVFSTKK